MANPFDTKTPTPLGNDTAVVYNYEKGQWSTWSNVPVVDARIVNGKLTMLQDDWEVWQEWEEYTHPDAVNGKNQLKIVTPWINVNEIKDYGRMYRIHVVGRYRSKFEIPGGNWNSGANRDGGGIRISLAYDYEDRDIHTYTWQGTDFQTEASGRAPRFELAIDPGRQKCQSIRLTFEEITDPSGGFIYADGQGWEISHLRFRVGVKPATHTISSAERLK